MRQQHPYSVYGPPRFQMDTTENLKMCPTCQRGNAGGSGICHSDSLGNINFSKLPKQQQQQHLTGIILHLPHCLFYHIVQAYFDPNCTVLPGKQHQ